MSRRRSPRLSPVEVWALGLVLLVGLAGGYGLGYLLAWLTLP